MIYLDIDIHTVERHQYLYYIHSDIIYKFQRQISILYDLKQMCSAQKCIQISDNIDSYAHEIIFTIYMYNRINNVVNILDLCNSEIHLLYYKDKLSVNEISAKVRKSVSDISKTLSSISHDIKYNSI